MITVLATVAAILLLLLAFDRLAPARAARIALALERRRCGLAARIVSIPGACMPYLEGGHGEPVVLLHGFGADKENFTRVAAFLASSYRVVIPDLPGFGDASRNPQAGYGPAEQAANLRAFLQALGLERVHLGGNSMGGGIAVEFAARHPSMVASLWLLDAAGTAAGYDTPMVRHYHETGDIPLLLRAPGEFDALLRACTVRPPFIPWSVRRTLALRACADRKLHADILRQLYAAPGLEQQFERIDVPALIVWGARDTMLNPKGVDALAALLPDSRVLVMPGVGHLPMAEAPRQCAADYAAFLQVRQPAFAQ